MNFRKALLPILVIMVGIGLIVSYFQGPIASQVASTAIENKLSASAFENFDDGLHVVLCGSGGPLNDPVRSGPCVAVIAGDRLFVVDAGAAAHRNLTIHGFRPGLVQAVFLTHFHSDHIGGLGELGAMRWVGGSWKTPLPVYGPEGVREVANGLNQAYRLDTVYRTAHHGSTVAPPTGAGLAAEAFSEPAPGEAVVVLEDEGVRVSAFAVDHEPVKPAIGYRFDYAGRSVVISGDTSKSENLEKFATGVDLLVHGALSPELMGLVEKAAADAGQPDVAMIAKDVLTYHATPIQAAESAETAGAKHLLFYHVVPATPIPGLASVFLDGVSDVYGGPVTLGRDGTTISLPRDSEQVDVVSE